MGEVRSWLASSRNLASLVLVSGCCCTSVGQSVDFFVCLDG